MERYDLLPNLQLLEGAANVAKRAQLPGAWWRDAEPDENVRAAIFASQDMTDLPEAMAGFLQFYELRRVRLEEKLRKLLGIKKKAAADAELTEDDELALALN